MILMVAGFREPAEKMDEARERVTPDPMRLA